MKRLAACALAVTLAAAACGGNTTATSTVTTIGSSTTVGAATPTTTGASGCPSSVFLVDEVNSYVQAAGYPDPQMSVTCTETSFTVTSNDIPNFEFVQITPNALQTQDFSFTFPFDPVERSTPGAIGLGPIGISVTGMALFGAFEAPQDGYQDPFLDGLLDSCDGHTAPGGLYHFHARFDCIFDNPQQPGLVYGYLFDGYQVVGPWVCDDTACTGIHEVTSSYVRTDPNSLAAFEAWTYEPGSGDLDECNGMTGADGVYRYYLTDEFPYMPFCFHGETPYAQGDFTGTAPAGGPGGPPPGA